MTIVGALEGVVTYGIGMLLGKGGMSAIVGCLFTLESGDSKGEDESQC